MKAQGTFDVKLTPQAVDAPGDEAVVGRMIIDKTFSGELQGTSRGQMLAARTAVEGSAGYVAIERVTGSLHGAQGSFHLQHSGTMNRGEPSLTLTVIPDSGTDGLTGLRGAMKIIIEGTAHSYDFDYELPE